MDDETPLIVAVQPTRAGDHGGVFQMTHAQLKKLTCYAYYPSDWLRYGLMLMGARPALMRVAKRPPAPSDDASFWKEGDPDPEVTWMYVLQGTEISRDVTFDKLEAQHQQLSKLLQAMKQHSETAV